MLFFRQKCDEELIGRAGGQTLPKTVTVTILLLFGHVMLCGKLVFIKLSEGPMTV